MIQTSSSNKLRTGFKLWFTKFDFKPILFPSKLLYILFGFFTTSFMSKSEYFFTLLILLFSEFNLIQPRLI